MIGIVTMIVVGATIGLLVRVAFPRRSRIRVSRAILCGTVGALLGSFGYGAFASAGFGSYSSGWLLTSTVVGSAALLVLVSLLSGRRRQPASEPHSKIGTSSQVKGPHIFVSYRRAEALALAGRIADHLERRFPDATVFYDIDSIAPGVHFPSVIDDALQQSDVLLAVVDRHWTTLSVNGRRRLDEPGDYVAMELRTGAQLGIPIIPVIEPFASVPTAAALPPDLAWFAAQHAFFLHQDIGFEDEMTRLDDRLTTLFAQHRP